MQFQRCFHDRRFFVGTRDFLFPSRSSGDKHPRFNMTLKLVKYLYEESRVTRKDAFKKLCYLRNSWKESFLSYDVGASLWIINAILWKFKRWLIIFSDVLFCAWTQSTNSSRKSLIDTWDLKTLEQSRNMIVSFQTY